jgi:hypothetical protein
MSEETEVLEVPRNYLHSLLITAGLGIGLAGGGAAGTAMGGGVVISESGDPSPALELYVSRKIDAALLEYAINSRLELAGITEKVNSNTRILRAICREVANDKKECEDL